MASCTGVVATVSPEGLYLPSPLLPKTVEGRRRSGGESMWTEGRRGVSRSRGSRSRGRQSRESKWRGGEEEVSERERRRW